MLIKAEPTQDFLILNQQYKRLAGALLEMLDIPATRLRIDADPQSAPLALDGDRFYYVESGALTARYRDRAVYQLDDGDLLLPDIAGAAERRASVSYSCEGAAALAGYPALEFMRQVFRAPGAASLWTRLLVTHAGLQLRLAAALTDADPQATPGFAVHGPGEVIIRQGERADFVFNLLQGTAEAVVDGVGVGVIESGEIFGAMAVLTRSERSASVLARTRCSVVKVPGEQFADLIRAHPATIHNLLKDMANSIVSLNERLVGLRGSYN